MVEFKNYCGIKPHRKCNVTWFGKEEPQKPRIMSTAEFAQTSGFPVRLIRDYCRDGLITCWRHGDKKFLIDYNLAIRDLLNLTVRRRRGGKQVVLKQSKSDKQKEFLESMAKYK